MIHLNKFVLRKALNSDMLLKATVLGGATLGILDKLFGFAAEKAVETVDYQQSTLGKASKKLVQYGLEAEKILSVSSDVRSQIAPMLSKMYTDEISIDSFKHLYEIRLYNLHSHQCDIRALKQLDSEGVYVFHNVAESTYQIGKATYLFKKINRIIEGYDLPFIHSKMKAGCSFTISAVRLANTDYESIDELLHYYKSRYSQ